MPKEIGESAVIDGTEPDLFAVIDSGPRHAGAVHLRGALELLVLAVYPFLQKYFMKGIVLGGVKV